MKKLAEQEFLNEAFNFQSDKPKNSISSNNVEACHLISSTSDKRQDKNSNGYSNKHNLLRCKGSSPNTFPNSGSVTGCLRPSPVSCVTPNNEHANGNAKRIANFHHDNCLEPRLKKQISSLGNDKSFNSTGSIRNNVSEHMLGIDHMLAESKGLNGFDFNPSVSSTSNLSNGLRYTQNTASAVSSRTLTNNRPANLAGPCTPLARKTSLCGQQSSPTTKSFTQNRYNDKEASQNLLRSTISSSVSKQSQNLGKAGGCGIGSHSSSINNRTSNLPITSNKCKERDSSQNLLRSTMSPAVSKTSENRLINDSSNHLRRTDRSKIGDDSLSTHNLTNSNLVTPNRYSHGDLSVDKRGSKVLTSANAHTPKLRGFAKESPLLGNLRTPTTERRCLTPRRFPGPAGILPKLDLGQSLDNLSSPSSETPKRKSPELCQLIVRNLANLVSIANSMHGRGRYILALMKVTGDSDEDFTLEPWTLMQEKISKDFPDSSDSLSSVITKAASHQLERGKVAFLPVLVKSFRPTGLDVSIVLKDPSGEMRGTLHRKVLEQQDIVLGPGCGLFLRQVSVFSPSPRKHYLNITPGNILEIFPASAERCGSQKIVEATPKRGPKEIEKQMVCSNLNKGIEQPHPFEETNFDELLEGLTDDDDMLVEAMNC